MSRAWQVLGLVSIVVAIAAYVWTGRDRAAGEHEIAVPASTTAARDGSRLVQGRTPNAPSSPPPTNPSRLEAVIASPSPHAPPSVVDFSRMAHPHASGTAEEPRFRTNEWFSEEDRDHPELYFALAEQMPELRRSEERRDALAYFVAYRDKLQRDLEAAGQDEARRHDITEVIERYNDAITHLRELLASGGGD